MTKTLFLLCLPACYAFTNTIAPRISSPSRAVPKPASIVAARSVAHMHLELDVPVQVLAVATSEAEGALRSLPLTYWTLIAAAAVLGIGETFELVTHTIRHKVASSLLPVVEAILAEVTTLGFSGLLLGTLQASSEESWIGQFSERYLGEAGLLFELFEGVDHALFPTTMAFVTSCALLVVVVNGKFESFKRSTQGELLQAKLAEDEARDACSRDVSSASCEFARSRSNKINGLLLTSMQIPGVDGERVQPIFGPLRDVIKPDSARRAEFLRFRARFIEQSREYAAAGSDGLPDDFFFGRYLQLAAAENLRGLVSVDPAALLSVWAPLIAFETCLLTATGGVDGDFLPSLFGLAQLPIAVWALWNFVRLNRTKTLLMPQLGVVTAARRATSGASTAAAPNVDPTLRLLPPRYKLLGGSFRERSWLDALAFFERPFGTAAGSEHEELFGVLGANGPSYYLNSMKLVLFSAIVSLAFFGSGSGSNYLTAECSYGALTAIPSALAVCLTPFTFLDYNWVTSVEGYRRVDVVDAVLRDQRNARFRSTLTSLTALCTAIEAALDQAEGEGNTTSHGPTRTVAEVDAAWAELLATQPPERLLDVRALFEAQDEDASGAIGFEEVENIVRQLGYSPSTSGIQALFARMDVDGSGEISFSEFATAVIDQHVSLGRDVPSAAAPRWMEEKLFNFFDVDGSGAVSQEEMYERLNALGFDSRGVAVLFADICGDKSQVSRKDFVRYVGAMPHTA